MLLHIVSVLCLALPATSCTHLKQKVSYKNGVAYTISEF